MIEWNVRAMFAYVNGTAGMFAVLDNAFPNSGLRLPTVSVWHNRARISAQWLPVVVAELLSRGMCLGDMLADAADIVGRQGEPSLEAVGL